MITEFTFYDLICPNCRKKLGSRPPIIRYNPRQSFLQNKFIVLFNTKSFHKLGSETIHCWWQTRIGTIRRVCEKFVRGNSNILQNCENFCILQKSFRYTLIHIINRCLSIWLITVNNSLKGRSVFFKDLYISLIKDTDHHRLRGCS